MSLLSDYLYLTQQLLRDANNRFFTQQFLVVCINNARDKVCVDCVVSRTNPNLNINPGQEVYTYSAIQAAVLAQSPAPPSRSVAAVLNVNFNQTGSLSPPLRRMAWSDFNRIFRSNPQTSFPLAFADYGAAQSIYIAPVPASTGYTLDVDCLYLPTKLVNPNDNDTLIPDPVTELVPFMAAFWATQYEQDATRATGFMANYEVLKNYMMAGMPPWSVLNRGT
jgi:hypothetical protein